MKNLITSAFLACLFTTTACICGCRKEDAKTTNAPADTLKASDSVSDVPLRLWIVGNAKDVEMVERRWRSESEQPIELSTISITDLLDGDSCDCDAIVFPSYLIGELVKRRWIVPLPASIANAGQSADSGQASDTQELNLPSGWRTAGNYAGQAYGIPMGVAVPVFVANDSLGNKNAGDDSPSASRLSESRRSLTGDALLSRWNSAWENNTQQWEGILKQVSASETEATKFVSDDVTVDDEAVVDRYLALLAATTKRDSKYGLLFEMQTMQPRLTEPEFVQSAMWLARLVLLNGDPVPVVGSHAEAWEWLAQTDQPGLSIVSPSYITQDQGVSGVEGEALSMTFTDSGSGSSDDKVVAWDTGRGMLASVSEKCRQSTRVLSLMRWLGSANTRAAVAPAIPGVDGGPSSRSLDSLGSQTERLVRQMVVNPSLPREPRLPAAHLYRQALAVALKDYLMGKASAKDALSKAYEKWEVITEQQGMVQRSHYERSLGLTL